MKVIFLFMLSVVISIGAFGQLSTVTGGNVGASISGGYLLNKPAGNGLGLSAGVTTSFYEIFFPEVSYEISRYDLGTDTTGETIAGKDSYLGLGLNNKIPFFSLKMGKSKHQECWYLNFKILFDYKYRLALGSSGVVLNPKNQSGINLGLGIRPSFSGADKSRVAWSFFYDFYYHLDLNKSEFGTLSDIQQNGLFFRLTVLHYQTSDMLGSGSKKKSYKKKY